MFLTVKNGINVPFYTADGPTQYMLDAGSIEGAAIGLDSGSNEKDFEQAKKKNPNVPSFSSETYPGWLTHWGEKWARPDTNTLKKEVEFLLKNKKSFNFYVIHGGTNFGFKQVQMHFHQHSFNRILPVMIMMHQSMNKVSLLRNISCCAD